MTGFRTSLAALGTAYLHQGDVVVMRQNILDAADQAPAEGIHRRAS